MIGSGNGLSAHLSAPGGSHVGPMNLAIRDILTIVLSNYLTVVLSSLVAGTFHVPQMCADFLQEG